MARTPAMGVRFRQTRWPAGYSVQEVDNFVALVEDALASVVPRVSSTDVAACRFTPVQFKPGYDMNEVDEYLEQARRLLRDREDQLPPSVRQTHQPAPAGSPGHCPGCRCAELGLAGPSR